MMDFITGLVIGLLGRNFLDVTEKPSEPSPDDIIDMKVIGVKKEDDSPVEIKVETENIYYVTKGGYTRLYKPIDILIFADHWPQTKDELRTVLTNMLLVDMAKERN